jgi:hypothetical protein
MNITNLDKIIDWCEEEIKVKDYVTFPEELFENMSKKDAEYLSDYLQDRVLIKLPEKEIAFFEWLKDNDNSIWKDLWEGDINRPYVVGINFLPLLIYSEKRGYPICDLEKTGNYFFTESHMQDEESIVLTETAYEKLKKKEKLSNSQLLLLEIKSQPTDIWHFAYKYKLDVEYAKSLVHELAEDNALVHLKETEYIAPFIDF